MTPLLTDGARDARSLSQFDKLYQTLAQELQRVYYEQRFVDMLRNMYRSIFNNWTGYQNHIMQEHDKKLKKYLQWSLEASWKHNSIYG